MNKLDFDKPNKRKIAFDRIVSIAGKVSSRAAHLVFILGGFALIMTNTNPDTLPPALAMAAHSIGLNLISSLIDRLAIGESISDDELEFQIKNAISESGIEQVLIKIEQLPTKDEFIDEFNKLLEMNLHLADEVSLIRSELLDYSLSGKSHNITIETAIKIFIDDLHLTHSENTIRSYRTALNLFQNTLENRGVPISSSRISTLDEQSIYWYMNDLNGYSPATEQLYVNAVRRFYRFLAEKQFSVPNIPRLDMLINRHLRPVGAHLPQHVWGSVENVLHFAVDLINIPTDSFKEQLRNLRDRAFIITLADSGMRVNEACHMHIGDIAWNQGYAILNDQSNNREVIRLSSRSLEFVKEYLLARLPLDRVSGKPLTSLPLFARHDRGAGKKVKPITTRTGQNIISQRVREALGEDAVGTITPHSFRHYFVTTVLRGSGGNLKLAQELARHKNIAVTQRYAHLSDDELDRGYADIFD